MRVRLSVLLGVLVLALGVAAAPAAAAGTGGLTDQTGVGTVLGPGQTIVADRDSDSDCGCRGGGSRWDMGSSFGGSPFGMGFGGGYPGFLRPWWAGMPLSLISASTGFTWPFAPWYYTPQWWTLVALSNIPH
jgi:hypothetical protein